MSEQIVYLCGCRSAFQSEHVGEFETTGNGWGAVHVGRKCPACNQPVRAVNITRLERENQRLRGLQRAVNRFIEADDERDTALRSLKISAALASKEEGE